VCLSQRTDRKEKARLPNKGSKTSGQLVHSDKKVLYLALYFLINGVGLIARQFLASTVVWHLKKSSQPFDNKKNLQIK